MRNLRLRKDSFMWGFFSAFIFSYFSHIRGKVFDLILLREHFKEFKYLLSVNSCAVNLFILHYFRKEEEKKNFKHFV